jgi:hypothetical protein
MYIYILICMTHPVPHVPGPILILMYLLISRRFVIFEKGNLYVYVYVYIYVYRGIHIYIYINVCIHVYIYAYIYVYVYMYTYKYLCLYKYTRYIHIHRSYIDHPERRELCGLLLLMLPSNGMILIWTRPYPDCSKQISYSNTSIMLHIALIYRLALSTEK